MIYILENLVVCPSRENMSNVHGSCFKHQFSGYIVTAGFSTIFFSSSLLQAHARPAERRVYRVARENVFGNKPWV